MMNKEQFNLGIIKGFLIAHNAPIELLDAFECVANPMHTITASAISLVEEIAKTPATPALDVPQKQKKPHIWSPEQRKAAGDRIRARTKAKKEQEANQQRIEDKNKSATPVAPPPPPRKDTPAEKLIDKHTGYVGTREDRVLVPHDWGDIQKMRYNGLPDERIAKSYSVELDYLHRFTKQMEEKDKLKSGNF